MNDNKLKMNEDDFNRANFFTPADEFAALTAAKDAKAKRRATRTRVPDDIKALKAFVKAMRYVDANSRRAAIRWLVDRYMRDTPPPVEADASTPAVTSPQAGETDVDRLTHALRKRRGAPQSDRAVPNPPENPT